MSGKGEKKRRRALDAYTRLQRAAALSAAQVEAAVAPFGLSASQFGVLDTIATRGAVHQQELAEALGRSKAQMTAIIDALETRALVRRERHAVDRRFITVHLTPEGRALLARATPERTDAIVALMGTLTGEQRARLARLCRRMLRVLDPYEDEEGDEADDEEDDADRTPSLVAAPPRPRALEIADGAGGSGDIASGGFTQLLPPHTISDGRPALPPDPRPDSRP